MKIWCEICPSFISSLSKKVTTKRNKGVHHLLHTFYLRIYRRTHQTTWSYQPPGSDWPKPISWVGYTAALYRKIPPISQNTFIHYIYLWWFPFFQFLLLEKIWETGKGNITSDLLFVFHLAYIHMFQHNWRRYFLLSIDVGNSNEMSFSSYSILSPSKFDSIFNADRYIGILIHLFISFRLFVIFL